MDWIECTGCWAEFKIISDLDQSAQFCPYCGEPIEVNELDSEDLEEM